jgi:putative ABC transport system permease protein
MLFVVAAVVGLASMIALLPALQGFARPVHAAWARSRSTDSRGLMRAREALIVADVAIAFTLAIGAGVMIRSLDRLLAVDPGFVATDVQTVGMSLVGPRWAEDSAVYAFHHELLSRVKAMPGVQGAAISGQVPLGGNYDRRGGYLEERNTQRAEDGIDFERYSITPDYLKLMGIPLLRGRPITDEDRTETTPVMLVSDTAARKYWPGQDPIGKRVVFGRQGARVTVVGVVGDVRHYGLDEPPAPQMYRPQAQMTDSFIVMAIKTAEFDRVLPQLREAARSLGSDVPIFDIHPMREFVERSAAPRRFAATLLGLFATIAAMMTAAGLYGLVAYAVARRTREFGIRLALGAPASGIRRLVVARGLVLTIAGALAGVLLALPLTRLLGDQLYQTSAFDAGALTMAFAVLATISLIAHLVPVARATRVSPTEALRGE